MSWKDREYKRRELSTPFIQWVNDGATLNPPHETGGFAFPVPEAQVLGTRPDGQEATLRHRSGKTTQVWFTHILEVAPLATRFCWLKDGEVVPKYEAGARGKLQVYSYMRDWQGNPAGPVVLTVSGTISKMLNQLLREWRSTVRDGTGGEAPSYAFFLPLISGDRVSVGSGAKSSVTELTRADIEFDPSQAWLGNAVLDALNWDEVDAWVAEWNGNGRQEESGDAVVQAGQELGGRIVDTGTGEILNDVEPGDSRICEGAVWNDVFEWAKAELGLTTGAVSRAAKGEKGLTVGEMKARLRA